MLSFICYVVATIIFFLVAHGDKVVADAMWGFFFVSLGLALSFVPALYNNYRGRGGVSL